MRTLLASVLSWLVILVVAPRPACGQTTWAERLGYPAQRRVVIIHADDLGAAYEFNRAAYTAAAAGRLQSVGVVVPGAWTAEVAEWRAQHLDFDLGISLSFVAPCPVMRWGPVAEPKSVPSLITPAGSFASTVKQFATRANVDDVVREAQAQLDRAIAMGLRPTHIIPHMGTLFERPEFLDAYFRLAEHYWIPAVMVELTPSMIARLQQQGRTIDSKLVELVAQYRLPKIDNVATVRDAASYEEKRNNLYTTIRDLPPGITQLFLTPADDSAALRRMTPRWQNREWERQLLADPEVNEFFKKNELMFTDWVEIMRRFEAESPGTRRSSSQ